MNGEVKRLKTDKKGNQTEVWEKVHRMAKNDLRDASIYSIVAGHIERLNNLMPEQPKEVKTLKSISQNNNRSRSVAERRRMERSRRI